MDLTKLREAIGAGKEQSDEQVLTAAVAKLGEGKTAADALQLSRTKIDGYDALLTRAETAERKVLELSRDPDPDVLADRADLMAQKIDLCLSRGQCTKQQADLMLGMLKDGDKPHALMLSRSGPSGTPIDAMLKVLELNQSLTGFQRTEGQPVARQTPGAGGEAKPITPERKQELLAMAGLPAK